MHICRSTFSSSRLIASRKLTDEKFKKNFDPYTKYLSGFRKRNWYCLFCNSSRFLCVFMLYFIECMFFSNSSCQPYVINTQLRNTDNICTDLYILLKPQSELGYLGSYLRYPNGFQRGFSPLGISVYIGGCAGG